MQSVIRSDWLGIDAAVQIVPYIERVLYAEDDEGAAQAMEDCRHRFSAEASDDAEAEAAAAASDDPMSTLVGQMSPLRV